VRGVGITLLFLLLCLPASNVAANCDAVVTEGYLHLDYWNGARTHGFVHCRDKYGSPAFAFLDVAHHFYVQDGWGVGGLIWVDSVSSFETTTYSTGPFLWIGCPRDCYVVQLFGYDTKGNVGGESYGYACADWNLLTKPAVPPIEGADGATTRTGKFRSRDEGFAHREH
jgi:hypothetical protein